MITSTTELTMAWLPVRLTLSAIWPLVGWQLGRIGSYWWDQRSKDEAREHERIP